jgi:hypothetical protein
VAAEWTQNFSVAMRCLNGEDAGIEFEYSANSFGMKKAFDELVSLFKAQLDLDPTRIIPVVSLESESYRHPTWGQIFEPIFNVLRWVNESELPAFDTAPAAQPAAAAPTPQQQPAAPTPQQQQPEPAQAAAPPPRRGRGRPAAAQPAAAAAPTAAAAPAAATTGTRSRRRAG